MYYLSIILDKSDERRLSGVRLWQKISLVMILLGLIINFLIKINNISNIILVLLMILIIASMLVSEHIFKEENSIHGQLDLDFFNEKEVGVFKSEHDETMVLDFENIIKNNGRVYKTLIKNKLATIKIVNKNTTVLYNNKNLIRCAIALYIRDYNLISYLARNGYTK